MRDTVSRLNALIFTLFCLYSAAILPAIASRPVDNSPSSHIQPYKVRFNQWHTSILGKETVAEDYNRYFHFVGMPKSVRCQFMGPPVLSKNGSDYFVTNGPYPVSMLEVQYTDDNQRILRFRMVEKNGDQIKIEKFSEWQTKDFRKTPDEFRSSQSILLLDSQRDPLLLPYGLQKFSVAEWSRGLSARWWILYDLVHSYPIIGMPRDKIHNLLGTPNSWASFDPRDPLTKDTEAFMVWPPQGAACLQIAYSNELVTAFRMVFADDASVFESRH